jgi:hypothetical protein
MRWIRPHNDDVTYVYDDVTFVYDDVTQVDTPTDQPARVRFQKFRGLGVRILGCRV